MEGLSRTFQRMAAPLWRRLQLLVGRAVLTAIDDSDGYQRLQLTLLKDEVRSGVARIQNYGFTSVPLPGAYAVVLFTGGDRGAGAAVAVEDARHRPTGWLPGETGVYDHLGKFIRLRADGTLEINAPRIVLNADAEIELNAGENIAATAGENIVLDAGVELGLNGAENVRLWAGVSYRWDVHGYAEQLDWSAGTIWQPVNYKTGATLSPAIDNAIDPPKVEA